MTTDEMACRDLVEAITDYLEDALPGAERARFEDHLAECPGCQAYLAQMRQTIRALGCLRAESLDPATQADLLRLFGEWKRRG